MVTVTMFTVLFLDSRRPSPFMQLWTIAAEEAAAIETMNFNDGGDGRLWLTISAEAHLSAEQIGGLATQFAH
jgi:hypothetical protein